MAPCTVSSEHILMFVIRVGVSVEREKRPRSCLCTHYVNPLRAFTSFLWCKRYLIGYILLYFQFIPIFTF